MEHWEVGREVRGTGQFLLNWYHFNFASHIWHRLVFKGCHYLVGIPLGSSEATPGKIQLGFLWCNDTFSLARGASSAPGSPVDHATHELSRSYAMPLHSPSRQNLRELHVVSPWLVGNTGTFLSLINSASIDGSMQSLLLGYGCLNS